MLFRIDYLHADSHNLRWRIELASLLSSRIRELLNEILVRSAEQVRELEVRIVKRNLLEVLDEVRERVVVQRALADLSIEVDALWRSLRTSRATWMIEAGANPKDVQGQMRPSRIQTTLDIYAQFVPE